MRLLWLKKNGAFSLIEYIGSDVPPYAILSHTWGSDNEELTFKDVMEGTGKNKTGYRKLTFCGKQAAKDGLQHFWVDTCCIDKSSSAELTEAINSMFQWYQKADKCYVYLSDVSISSFSENEQSFQRSRWFTRGWTLQELVAPTSVEFFSSEGERIGDKNSMVQELHNVTNIPIQALQGTPLSKFSVTERMSWAKNRVTKREEDGAYSLLGIFNTYMPLIYGEGRENAFDRLHKEMKQSPKPTKAAETDTEEERYKYRIQFSLKGVPVGKFADRPQDTEALEQGLLPQKQGRRRRTIVVHGLGGMGKTQLAVDFARRHQHDFSSVLWLDGSSVNSLKQSIATFASRISAGQVAESSRTYASGQGGDLDAVVKDVLRWLSIPANGDWLVVVDNVDRDCRRRDEDAEAYDVEEYVPEADHGSVLITTRLPYLGQLGEQWEVKKVSKKRARAIFETWYGREIGQEGDELLGLLDGLPLALAQAAAYMNETGTRFGTYTRLYNEQWRGLMEPHDKRYTPLRSYANGSVATTWMVSYTAIRERSEAAANLLLLWAHLDNKSMWHGLLVAASQVSAIAAEQTSAWLGEIARSEMEFIKAIRMLRSYSLVEETEDQSGYSTHAVVHQWALHIQNDDQKAALSWVAIVTAGLAVPESNTRGYWEAQVRLLSHAGRCERGIERAMDAPFEAQALDAQKENGEVEEEDKEEKTLLRAVNKLGSLYWNQGKLDKAEKMYMWALEEKEKELGADHISTLSTAHRLAGLYRDQGKLDIAENMCMRVLEGCKKTLGADQLPILRTVQNLGSLYREQGKLDKAEKMYMQALERKEKALGADHKSTLKTVNSLGNLYRQQGKLDKAEKMYMRVLEAHKKAVRPTDLSTFVPALNTMCGLGSLSDLQHCLEDAATWYSQALSGYQTVFGDNHPKCEMLRRNLAALAKKKKEIEASNERLSADEQQTQPISRRLKLLQKLGWKQV